MGVSGCEIFEIFKQCIAVLNVTVAIGQLVHDQRGITCHNVKVKMVE
jgi:hypothetical protein